jgi:hypothetical protein
MHKVLPEKRLHAEIQLEQIRKKQIRLEDEGTTKKPSR